MVHLVLPPVREAHPAALEAGPRRRRRAPPPALALGGYAAARVGEDVTQTGGAHTAILLGFTLLPALLMAAALAVQSRYRLDARFTAPR